MTEDKKRARNRGLRAVAAVYAFVSGLVLLFLVTGPVIRVLVLVVALVLVTRWVYTEARDDD